MIILQYCIGFYQASTWIRHRFTHVSSHLNIHPHFTHLGCEWALVWVPWIIEQIPIGCLFYIWQCMFYNVNLNTEFNSHRKRREGSFLEWQKMNWANGYSGRSKSQRNHQPLKEQLISVFTGWKIFLSKTARQSKFFQLSGINLMKV